MENGNKIYAVFYGKFGADITIEEGKVTEVLEDGSFIGKIKGNSIRFTANENGILKPQVHTEGIEYREDGDEIKRAISVLKSKKNALALMVELHTAILTKKISAPESADISIIEAEKTLSKVLKSLTNAV